MQTPRRRAVMLGLMIAVAYGLAAYVTGASTMWSSVFSVLTVGFLGFVPFAVGYLSVLPIEEPRYWARVVVPWTSFAFILLICWFVRWEGTVCIVLALPWLMVFSSVGGLMAGFVKDGRKRRRAAAGFALLPFLVVPLETRIPSHATVHHAVASVMIQARPADVWEYVVSVDTIRADERARALYTSVGFPAPIAATLDHARLGGVRRASFEGNVVFTETITDWMDRERLSFSIKPNTAEIPVTTLDPHVTVGGAYFDVLNGSYELEPVGDTATRLVLTSEYRVSTHFNSYSGWWADRIMQSVQSEILRVLRVRSETAARTQAPVLTADMRELEAALLGHARDRMQHGMMLVDDAMIVTGSGKVDSLGGVSIPGFATPGSVDESLRSVLAARAAEARTTAWMTNFGAASELRYEFEDRMGRCVNVRRPVSVTPDVPPAFGPRTLAKCDVNALAEAIRRGRRIASIPFHERGLGVIFTAVGDYPGTVDVFTDSVVVTVRGGVVRTKLLDGHPQNVDSLTASLAGKSGTSWSPGRPSNAIPLAMVAREGESRDIPRLRFTIPRDSGESLADRWVVITYHLTVPKTAGNPYGTAWTYTHLTEGMFREIH